MSHSPTRLSIPTCTGCGSISQWGTCEGGCREQRVDVVRGDLVEWMEVLAERSHLRAEQLRAAAQRVAEGADGAGTDPWELTQRAATEALSSCPDLDATDDAWDDPPIAVVVWRCDACGGASAPQDCLGICTWRVVEWAPAAAYDEARAHAEMERTTESRLRSILRKVA